MANKKRKRPALRKHTLDLRTRLREFIGTGWDSRAPYADRLAWSDGDLKQAALQLLGDLNHQRANEEAPGQR